MIWVKFPVQAPRPLGQSESARAVLLLDGKRGDLDHHAVDHPRQPRHQLRPGDRLRPLPRRERSGEALEDERRREGRRAADPGRRPGRGGVQGGQDHRLDPRRDRRSRRAGLRPPPGHARPRLRLRRAAPGGRPRHRRRGHGLRAHRAGARGRRTIKCGWPRAAATSPRRSTQRRLLRRRAPVRRPAGDRGRGQARRQVRPRQRRGDGQAARGRRAPGPRPAGAQLPPLLALQGAGALPQHAAVVHLAWTRPARRRPALRKTALDAHRRHRLLPRERPHAHPRHGREPAGLADQPPARLGHAARHVRGSAHRRAAARPRGQRPHPGRRAPRGGADAWFTTDPAVFLGPGRDPADYEQRRRHPGRLVRLRLDPRLHAGGPKRQPRPRRPLSGGLRPGTAAGSSRRCWRAAATRGHAPVQGGAHPRLHPGRAGREDEQVQGQHRRSPEGDQPTPAPRSSACGWPSSTTPRTSASGRPSCRRSPTATASCATRSAISSAPWKASRRPSGCRSKRCRPWSAGSCTGCGCSTGEVRAAYEGYRFYEAFRLLADFAQSDLSALYFDIRKDSLYCDRPDSADAAGPAAR